jgi:glycine betaine catabolism B
VGQLVSITAPVGKVVLHSDYSRPAVFLSGGIGVTSFRSMIKYATDGQLPLNITMFDSNREEFDEWVELNKNLKIIYTLADGETEAQITQTSQSESKPSSDIDWRGERGFIDKDMLTKILIQMFWKIQYSISVVIQEC